MISCFVNKHLVTILSKKTRKKECGCPGKMAQWNLTNHKNLSKNNSFTKGVCYAKTFQSSFYNIFRNPLFGSDNDFFHVRTPGILFSKERLSDRRYPQSAGKRSLLIFRGVAKKAIPAVVSIKVQSRKKTQLFGIAGKRKIPSTSLAMIFGDFLIYRSVNPILNPSWGKPPGLSSALKVIF